LTNRLGTSSSPYLQQHADNPVSWQPWDDTALAQARRENKPILLSVGYSACHWCHVMAHESFEDADVANVMNEYFVNIKVDREERPDLDQIYQTAHALLTRQSGGWPLTMFLTPDGAPFFGGTYFPKESRYGRPGFLELLPQVAAAYREQGPAIVKQAAQLKNAMGRLEPVASGGTLPSDIGERAWRLTASRFDPVDGGFGAAPKFPHAAELEFALRRIAQRDDAEARNVVDTTLERMAAGGIHDHLGGGFCRYSVDAQWTIPHFEKMLYDNAALLPLYAAQARHGSNPAAAAVAEGIVTWLVREMRAGDGAFYSSLDADSEGEEGRFYVWQAGEVEGHLSADEWAVVGPHYGLDRAPNFEQHAWNLREVVPLIDVAAMRRIDPTAAAALLASAKAKLLTARATRVRPGRDDKILTSWNALMIAALARSSRLLGRPEWGAVAFAALDRLRATAWRDGRLLATRKDGDASLNAYLDDHAFLLAALIECMQSDFRTADLEWARELGDQLLNRFEDREQGGFWFTSDDHEPLFHRHKPGHDNATPSGNGVAARALAALAEITGEPRYREAALRTVGVFAERIAAGPEGYATLLLAHADLEAPPPVVLLDGDQATATKWRLALADGPDSGALVIDVSALEHLPVPLAKGARPARGAVAYVCRNFTCLSPITGLAELRRTL
jgi:uncharacterized protein